MEKNNPSSENAFPLSLTQPGERVRITSYKTGGNLEKKLIELGLNLRAEIEVIERQSNGLVLGRDTGRIAIGIGVAQKVMVVNIAAMQE